MSPRGLQLATLALAHAQHARRLDFPARARAALAIAAVRSAVPRSSHDTDLAIATLRALVGLGLHNAATAVACEALALLHRESALSAAELAARGGSAGIAAGAAVRVTEAYCAMLRVRYEGTHTLRFLDKVRAIFANPVDIPNNSGNIINSALSKFYLPNNRNSVNPNDLLSLLSSTAPAATVLQQRGVGLAAGGGVAAGAWAGLSSVMDPLSGRSLAAVASQCALRALSTAPGLSREALLSHALSALLQSARARAAESGDVDSDSAAAETVPTIDAVNEAITALARAGAEQQAMELFLWAASPSTFVGLVNRALRPHNNNAVASTTADANSTLSASAHVRASSASAFRPSAFIVALLAKLGRAQQLRVPKKLGRGALSSLAPPLAAGALPPTRAPSVTALTYLAVMKAAQHSAGGAGNVFIPTTHSAATATATAAATATDASVGLITSSPGAAATLGREWARPLARELLQCFSGVSPAAALGCRVWGVTVVSERSAGRAHRGGAAILLPALPLPPPPPVLRAFVAAHALAPADAERPAGPLRAGAMATLARLSPAAAQQRWVAAAAGQRVGHVDALFVLQMAAEAEEEARKGWAAADALGDNVKSNSNKGHNDKSNNSGNVKVKVKET